MVSRSRTALVGDDLERGTVTGESRFVHQRRVADERQKGVEGTRPTHPPTEAARLILEGGAHGLMVDREGGGDGPDLPVLAEIEAPDLGALRGRDHHSPSGRRGATAPGSATGSPGHTPGQIGRGRRGNVTGVESGVPKAGGGRLIPHGLPGAVGALMVSVIEAAFRTALMAGLGTLHRAPAGQETAACRAVGVAAVARRTDRKEAVAPAAGLLAKGLVYGVGVPGRPPTGRRNPNRGTTRATGSVCRRARRSRGSGGRVRTLTSVCVPPVRYRKHRGHTTAGAMDAAAGVDAHDAPTPACKTARRAVLHKRPQPVPVLLITPLKNPEAVPTLRHASRLLHCRVTGNSQGAGVSESPQHRRTTASKSLPDLESRPRAAYLAALSIISVSRAPRRTFAMA